MAWHVNQAQVYRYMTWTFVNKCAYGVFVSKLLLLLLVVSELFFVCQIMFGNPPFLLFVLQGPFPVSVTLTEFYWLARVAHCWLDGGSWHFLGVVRELATDGKKGCELYLQTAEKLRFSHGSTMSQELTSLLERGADELQAAQRTQHPPTPLLITHNPQPQLILWRDEGSTRTVVKEEITESDEELLNCNTSSLSCLQHLWGWTRDIVAFGGFSLEFLFWWAFISSHQSGVVFSTMFQKVWLQLWIISFVYCICKRRSKFVLCHHLLQFSVSAK